MIRLHIRRVQEDELKIYDYSDFYDQLSEYSLHSIPPEISRNARTVLTNSGKRNNSIE